MEKITKDEFKRRMRAAEIEKRINEADTKPIDEDDIIAKENHALALDIKAKYAETHPTQKRGPKPKTETPKKPGRPKKEPVAAEQEESLRFLIGVARGRTSEIIHNSEAHIKTAGKLADLAEIYDTHIKRVEEMLK